MTCGAKTDVLRELIVDSFAVAVTGYTRDRRIVVARIVAGSMGKVDWCPSVGGVAHIALLRGNKVSYGFSSGRIAIVTRAAATRYTLVIKCGAQECCCSMAVRTIQCRRYVIRVFAACGHPIVAGLAVVHDTGVIEHRPNKGSSIVTYTTILIGRDMRG